MKNFAVPTALERPVLVGACVLALGLLGATSDAHACSPSQTELYRSEKSVWCVENSIISEYGAFPEEFFPYGDQIVDELVNLFGVPAEGVYTYEASEANGIAHTSSECCGLGVTVTGDAFYNEGYGAKGYWGYLLTLHEMINDFTGQVTGGWPTDFWADHVSAYPNSLDWHIMDTLGRKNNDQNLINSGAAQKGRFYPGGDSVDPRVGMFDQIFDLPNYGYEGYGRVFDYIEEDGLSWDRLGVPNPDVKRTEYVIAYLSLGGEQSVTPIMQAAHVGDGTPAYDGDTGYTVNQANIDAIATAHCAIKAASAQGVDVTAARQALQSGNYANVSVTGSCGEGCPTECGCRSSDNACVAPWLGEPIGGIGDGEDGGDGPSEGTGDDGSTNDGAGDGASDGNGDGSVGDGTGDGATGDGPGGTDGSGSVDAGADGSESPGSTDSGCTLRAVGERAAGSSLVWLLTSGLGLVVVRRVRSRRR